MGVYYSVTICGAMSMLLAYVALIKENELQAVFLLFFSVLCAFIAVLFKLVELNQNIKKLLEEDENTET